MTQSVPQHLPVATVENNQWYHYVPHSNTVFVFIHGIQSDSHQCWRSIPTRLLRRSIYWPDLIANDQRFNAPSIYMGGYYSDIDAGTSSLGDCVDQVFAGLRRIDTPGRRRVLSYRNIVFVCHSMGGIVCRQMLLSHWGDFRSKRIGIALIASPSCGSRLADYIGPIARVYKNEQALMLRWKSEVLETLDSEFKRLLSTVEPNQLCGIEFAEHHALMPSAVAFLRWKWLPFKNRDRVVEKDSAYRYFSDRKLIPNTDHSSIVKPVSSKETVHQYLCDFVLENNLTDRADKKSRRKRRERRRSNLWAFGE